MRISGLAAATGVPVATIKFYLREGLLPQGEATAPTQATYDDRHVQRLRLVRSLVEVAGLSLAQVRRVVASIDNPPSTWHQLLGVAHWAAVGLGDGLDDDVDVSAARSLVDELGWHIDPRSPALAQLQRAISGLADSGLTMTPEHVRAYAEAAHDVAELDVDSVPTTSPAAAARHVVLGTLLREPLLLSLRRLAHEDVSASRFADLRPPAPPGDLHDDWASA
ncbi:MerR family transcriptional regulator [Angustibacter sp. McL0619]|uniref:MerR family transcriptional regulator n=1 Tax=Angustibacter sp. McL0619 TaxID=3415676 RepID=UPI003CF7D04D